jgi:glycosyltransferase involved in cell wall biosynthesis
MVGRFFDPRRDGASALAAFRQLRAEQPQVRAELHLKTTLAVGDRSIEREIPGVRLHGGIWTRDSLSQLYASSHVLLALSGGERLNLAALEFQSTGGVAIATAAGGHRVWLDPSYSYPVRVADNDQVKALMMHTYTHRDECRAKGDRAAQVVRSTFSWNARLDQFFELLAMPEGSAG